MFIVFSCSKERVDLEIASEQSFNDVIVLRENERGSSNCGNLDGLACVNGGTINHGPVVLEVYPGCFANASWTEERCEPQISPGLPNVFYMAITNFVVEPIVGLCDDVINNWESLSQSGDIDGLIAAINEFENDASLVLQELRMEGYFLEEHPFFFDCQADFATIAYVNFYKESCRQLWAYEFTPKGSDFSYTRYTTSLCGDVCCLRSTRYCYVDEDSPFGGGSHLIPFKPEITQFGSCFSDLPATSPGLGYRPIGDCSSTCLK